MYEFESLATTMKALKKEKERQEEVALERIRETGRALKQSINLEHLRQGRERQERQRRISYHQRQQRRIAELEATKILYQDEIEMLSTSAQSTQGVEAEQLQLMAHKRQLDIMEIEQELAGMRSQSRGLLRSQIRQIENRIEMLDEMLQTQEQMRLESQLRQMEEEKLREEAEKLVNAKRELEEKYPPEVANQILEEIRRLKARKMAKEDEF